MFHSTGSSYPGKHQIARLAKRHAEGRLNPRERLDRLVDAGSFMELGAFKVSDMPGDEERTPANSKVAGLATIDGRAVPSPPGSEGVSPKESAMPTMARGILYRRGLLAAPAYRRAITLVANSSMTRYCRFSGGYSMICLSP
jgi:carboxyltransferase family protein